MGESLQETFLRAHLLLHPQAAEMRELLDANVAARHVLELYPYDLEKWLINLRHEHQRNQQENPIEPEGWLTGRKMIWRGLEVKDSDLHAKLRGIQSVLIRMQLPADRAFLAEAELRCAAALTSTDGILLLKEMGFGIERRDSLQTVTALFSATNDVLTIASRWGDFQSLLEHEGSYRSALETALNALLPAHFKMERPLVTYDTMIFE